MMWRMMAMVIGRKMMVSEDGDVVDGKISMIMIVL